MSTTVLVSGGAGYIGSHVVRQLTERGDRVVVVDDLSTGHKDSVIGADLVVADVGDAARMRDVIRQYDVKSVLHFAAKTIVPESVSDPLKYYGANTCTTRNLLAACVDTGIEHFIFSSTAAVYGEPEGGVASEDTPPSPINPYGTSKLMSEWMLRDLGAASSMRYVILRYFNVAGSDPEGRIGQRTPDATLLVKVAAETAVGKREKMFVFGTDYATADGTGIRDYIHVEDLSSAHLLSLDYLRQGGASELFNCGYGSGASVREVLDAMAAVNGAPLNVEDAPRRPGDSPQLIAKADKIRGALGWEPRYADIRHIVESSLAWEKHLLSDS